MADLVALHGLDDHARARVLRGEPVEMPRQMRLDLPLGFLEEAKVPRVAPLAGGEAERGGARVPERVEQAGASAELGDARLGPGEVILLLKDLIRLYKVELPEFGSIITFYVPMPKSWSISKRKAYYSAPHQQKPDLDNLIKALCDAVYGDDSVIWQYSARKIWADEGGIDIEQEDE